MTAPDTRSALETSHNPFLHPFANPAKPESEFMRIVGAEGSTVFDDAGNAYIDGLASLWYCQVGHGRREIIDAITAQLDQLAVYNTFEPFTNEPAVEVSRAILERSPLPGGQVFLGCSGSEAVDTALKFMRMVAQLRGEPDRQIIVRRTGGYHGTNVGGTSVQGIEPNRTGWGDLLPHVIEVPSDDLEAAALVFADHGERIAGVITEPVQGAGGVHPPDDAYLPGLRRLCDDHGALLCLDEVICGFGRTGEWFGAQTWGVTPDLFTFAKGVTSGYQPLSGVAVSATVAETIARLGDMLRTGYTYSGHPTACAAGIANIELIEREGLVQRANEIGAWISDGLKSMAADGLIAGYRGRGGIWAAELDRSAVPARDAMLKGGVIIRPIGTAIAFCPPLVITRDEVGRMLDVFADAVTG